MRKATGSYRTYSSLVKLQPCTEFAVEDLPSGRTAALVPEFAVKDLPLGRTMMMMMVIRMKLRFQLGYFILWFGSFNGNSQELSRLGVGQT